MKRLSLASSVATWRVSARTAWLSVKPLTAAMIVVLALLDDIPIMTIAYDNVSAAP